MLGGFLALLAAITFALNNAAFRRGAVTGTVAQGMAISLALGVGIFLIATMLSGAWQSAATFPPQSLAMLCAAGILHFAWGRYCNFRATKAMGANLVGPPQQMSIVVTLVLAILILDENLTPLRLFGILLVVIGPALSLRPIKKMPVLSPRVLAFKPNYVEGYTFALLSALGYGTSPILVRISLQDADFASSIAAGLIAHIAAAVVMTVPLLSRGMRRCILSMDGPSRTWFSVSGVLVGLSQMTGYLALAIAPVSVVTPIQRLSLVFRVFANSLLNRDHEVIGGRVWAATAVGLLGAAALSVSTDFVLALVPLPEIVEAAARWQWP
ncbi:EamA family transporter [Sinorhizobium mexicanum]|uniref:DMT family transporter n=1 Tax=Sinorhizobium mexicanum TaxID=375549 RepID=A0A859QVZ9_9HYPH|nr:EamA family transporter [Sinorhizobium mexicanum]MBP1888184.1 putative membrane protein [Sinorhizobium mexicanum]QLL62971.1 DMT family transporter [Sinorhizobium mexicanum]